MEPVIFLIPLFLALAQSSTDFELPADVGVLPDNPFYGLDTALDNIRYWLASESDKARIGLEIAEERLVEVKAMINKNRINDALKAQDEHDKTLINVREVIADVPALPTEAQVEEELKTTIEVQERIMQHQARVDEVKQKVKLKLTMNRDKLTSNDNANLERITTGLDNAILRVTTKASEEKTRIHMQLSKDFGRDMRLVDEKVSDITKEVKNKVAQARSGY